MICWECDATSHDGLRWKRMRNMRSSEEDDWKLSLFAQVRSARIAWLSHLTLHKVVWFCETMISYYMQLPVLMPALQSWRSSSKLYCHNVLAYRHHCVWWWKLLTVQFHISLTKSPAKNVWATRCKVAMLAGKWTSFIWLVLYEHRSRLGLGILYSKHKLKSSARILHLLFVSLGYSIFTNFAP